MFFFVFTNCLLFIYGFFFYIDLMNILGWVFPLVLVIIGFAAQKFGGISYSVFCLIDASDNWHWHFALFCIIYVANFNFIILLICIYYYNFLIYVVAPMCLFFLVSIIATIWSLALLKKVFI